MPPALLEICVDSFESAVAAVTGGANRIELCSALSEGGLTPTVGLLREVKAFVRERDPDGVPKVAVYCMVRCRRGSDFRYSDHEMNVMVCDLRLLREHGADGFVFGALDTRGAVDRENCRRIVTEADGLPVTFHRAIDCTDGDRLRETLEVIAEIGFRTVLTSGLRPTALEGLETLVEMERLAKGLQVNNGDRLLIMPGSGVKPGNVVDILDRTGCQAIHASARIAKVTATSESHAISMGGTAVDAEPLLVCSEKIVGQLKELLDGRDTANQGV